MDGYADRQMDGYTDNVKTVYHQQTQLMGGYITMYVTYNYFTFLIQATMDIKSCSTNGILYSWLWLKVLWSRGLIILVTGHLVTLEVSFKIVADNILIFLFYI